MNELFAVTFDGRQYECTIDDEQTPDRAFVWTEFRTNMKPRDAVVAELNGLFIREHAARAAESLNPQQLKLFGKILKAMGAKSRDFERPGMHRLLKEFNPDRWQELQYEVLPVGAHGPLNCRVIRNWAFDEHALTADIPNRVFCLGQNPFTVEDFTSFLNSHRIEAVCLDPANHAETQLRDIVMPPLTARHVIIGREGWQGCQIDEVIDASDGCELRFYSQELFLAMLQCGRDPFKSGHAVLCAFRAGHEALEYVSSGWIGWVDPAPATTRRAGGGSRVNSESWKRESPLRVLGYHVGKDGLGVMDRQRILRQAFEQQLPFVNSTEYMAEWGIPASEDRLKKLAEFLAAMCRNNWQKEDAVRDWKYDLEWLRQKYYHGHFKFEWPNTNAQLII